MPFRSRSARIRSATWGIATTMVLAIASVAFLVLQA